MSLRIAIISERSSPLIDKDGSIAHAAKNLAALGHSVDVFVRRDSEHQPLINQWMTNLRVIHVPIGPPHTIQHEDAFPLMRAFSAFVVNFISLQGKIYDITHAHHWMSGIVAQNLKDDLMIPFVMTFPTLGRLERLYKSETFSFPSIRIKVEENLVLNTDHIIAKSPLDKEDLVRFYGARRQSVTIIPGGVDSLEIWPVDKTLARVILGLPENENIILQLGRLIPRKGAATTIRALKKLITVHKIPAHLILVGGELQNGELELTSEVLRLKNIAIEEGINDRVYFKGPCLRDDLKYYFSAADIAVTMPWFEPCGTTSLEAMACRRPVLGSNVGGLRFTIQDHRNGFLIPPMDSDSLADKMAYLFERPILMDIMGKFGKLRVDDRFAWRKIARAHSILYQIVIHSTKSSYFGLDTLLANGNSPLFDQWKERRALHEEKEAWAGTDKRMKWF